MTEDMISKMLNHADSDLDDRIKIALDLVEDFVKNHAQGVDDAFMARLKEHYTDAEVVELTVAVGLWDSVHKFNNVFDVHPPVEDGQFTVDPPDVPEGMHQHIIEPGNKYSE